MSTRDSYGMQQFIGRVVQAARNQTAKVAVERLVKEKKFLKVIHIYLSV